MQIIRCTAKLQKEMGLRKSDLIASVEESTRLGGWHANLLYIDRKKCVLFANDRTLFNFIVADLKREHIRQLDRVFQEHLICVLNSEDLDKKIAKSICEEHQEIRYGATNNRSVIGSMNDLASHYKYFISEAGGVHSPEVPEIIRKLNRMPFCSLEFTYSIDMLKKLYEGQA
jgi:hypothetical protein